MQNRTKKTPRMWSEYLMNHQAKIPCFMIIGVFVFAQLVTHDGQLYTQFERGGDPNGLQQLYFPQFSHQDDRNLLYLSLVVILILAVYAIMIRVAKWHYANHGISV